ncbi:MAG: polysaccharide deacetylase family protein [Lautropia sp.]|nr:polysaccharide deacetylase family protein [Lautropia sp.]
MRLSLRLHAVAALGVAAVAGHAGVTGGLTTTSTALLWVAVAVVVADHLMLTAAGLCPRCSLLGPNLTRLPEPAQARGLVAITLDDGPDPLVTPLVLDILKEAGASASFFLIGRKAEQHPALVTRMVAEGHSVENHSWAHSHRFAFSGPSRFRAEILRAQHSLGRLAGEPPRFFRAPAGMRNPLLEPVLSSLGLPLTSWTRRGFDTVTSDPARVLERLVGKDANRLTAGDILLLHDGHAAVAPDGRPVILSVLPQVLAACNRLRLRPVSLRQAMPVPAG